MEKFKAIIAYLIILVKAKMFCYYRHFYYFPKYSRRTDISFNCVFIRRPFLTRQWLVTLLEVIDSNDTHARMGDMAGNKKEHTRDIGTRCSRTRQWEVNFCRSRGTRGKRNVARKRISPINCQSNLATQKIPLPCFYDLPPASSTIYFRLNFRSASKKAHRPSRFFVALFQPFSNRIRSLFFR